MEQEAKTITVLSLFQFIYFPYIDAPGRREGTVTNPVEGYHVVSKFDIQ
jgi:hypothetical protein